MLTVASTAAVGFLVASWTIKYGVGVAYYLSGAKDKSSFVPDLIQNMTSRELGTAILEILKLALILLSWNYDSIASGPASFAAVASIGSLVEFTAKQQQDVLSSASSVTAFYIGAKDTSGSTHPILPSALIFVSVASLAWQKYYLDH